MLIPSWGVSSQDPFSQPAFGLLICLLLGFQEVLLPSDKVALEGFNCPSKRCRVGRFSLRKFMQLESRRGRPRLFHAWMRRLSNFRAGAIPHEIVHSAVRWSSCAVTWRSAHFADSARGWSQIAPARSPAKAKSCSVSVGHSNLAHSTAQAQVASEPLVRTAHLLPLGFMPQSWTHLAGGLRADFTLAGPALPSVWGTPRFAQSRR